MGEENIGEVYVEDKLVPALIDSGSTVSLMTPEYATERGFPVYPISDLSSVPIRIEGVGAQKGPLGYCVAVVRSPDIAGFDEETPFLILEDNTDLGQRCPIIIGTQVIDRMLNVMKESEMDKLSEPLARARGAVALRKEFLSRKATPVDGIATKPLAPREMNEIVRLKADTILPPHVSTVVEGVLGFCPTGNRLSGMIVAPPTDSRMDSGYDTVTDSDSDSGSESDTTEPPPR